jgi:hypothetical protein
MISKTTQNLVKRWKAKKALSDRGITHLNTEGYYNIVTQEAKKFDFKNESKEEIITHLDDEDTVRLE